MKKLFIISILILLLLPFCRNHEIKKEVDLIPEKPSRAIYYWKTIFSLNDTERRFLKENDIQKIYIRYFDVACREESWYIATPLGTIQFRDSIPPGLEVVPTVFIDNELFKSYDPISEYVERIVKRILIMSETNNIPNIKEVQIDCDWTKSSEEKYFKSLKEIRAELSKHNIKLSATIRLHQLKMPPPPVDQGVLMCYNTGAVLNRDTENSILTAMNVKPYASGLATYKLSLDIAYPTFSWAVWFRDKRFKSLLRGLSSDNENLVQLDKNIYQVKQGFYQEGHYLSTDDIIRFESSPMEEILKSKELLEYQLKNKYSIILYHLDSNNLSKYTNHEIAKIYNN